PGEDLQSFLDVINPKHLPEKLLDKGIRNNPFLVIALDVSRWADGRSGHTGRSPIREYMFGRCFASWAKQRLFCLWRLQTCEPETACGKRDVAVRRGFVLPPRCEAFRRPDRCSGCRRRWGVETGTNG